MQENELPRGRLAGLRRIPLHWIFFPLALLYYLYTQLVGFVGDKFNALTGLLQFLPVNEMFRILLPVGLALGVGIGFFGSFFTIRKHLKV